MKKVFTQFKVKYENRENRRNLPRDPICDPLVLTNEISNGNKSNLI